MMGYLLGALDHAVYSVGGHGSLEGGGAREGSLRVVSYNANQKQYRYGRSGTPSPVRGGIVSKTSY